DSLNPIRQKLSVTYNHPRIHITTSAGKNFDTELNKPFLINQDTFVFVDNPRGGNMKSDQFNVVVNDPTRMAKNLQNTLNAEIIGGFSTVLDISVQMANTSKAEAILNNLIEDRKSV